MKVLVVGGGLAGISAALALADAGAPVTLLEGKARLGGATWSFRRHGLSFDNGQHVFLRCCTSYRAFLDRIGASSSVQLQDRLDIPVVAPGGRQSRLRRHDLPAPLHLAGSLARYRHLSWADRLRLGRALLPLRRADLADPGLDDVTFADFLRRHGQSDAAIARLWDLICVPTVNLPAAEASLTLAATVFQVGLLTDAAASDIGWSRLPLAELHGDRAAAALERAGVTVRTSTPVQRIEADGGAIAATTATDRFVVDAAVIAVPHDAAARLLADLIDGAVRWPELGSSPIVNVNLVYDRRVVEEEFFATVDSPLQFVFDRTVSSGLLEGPHEGGQCLAVSLSAAASSLSAPADELAAMANAELARLFPAVSSARLLDSVVVRERAATFAGRPGTRRLRPGPATDVPGLYLAGAWTDTGWPATMEGAVRSGLAAAAAAGSGRRAAAASSPTVPHPEEALA
jgi:squalene-associated FAD-dependent desaturase